jgi:RNA polymerase sigma-70 factor (sigma-E family)
LTGDRHLAEDLVQATLFKIYLRWSRSGSWDAPVAYAQRTLYTTFCSWRGRKWVAERPVEQVPDVAAPPSVGDSAVVDEALRALPRRQRAVVIARFYDDLSVRQTADLLGIAEGTVKSQTARALDALRAALVATQPSPERP